MPVTYSSKPVPGQLRRPYYPGHKSSYLELIPEEDDEDISREDIEAFARMADITEPNKSSAKPSPPADLDQMAAAKDESLYLRPTLSKTSTSSYNDGGDYLSAGYTSNGGSTPSTPGFVHTPGSSDGNGNFESFGQNDFPPVDRLTMFDILENLALPQRLEKMQHAVHVQAEKVRRQRARLASRAVSSKNNLVDEWRKRVPLAPDEQLSKYRRRMRNAVDRIGKRWNDSKNVTLKEKISFVTAVLNIFISAYMMPAFPEYFHYWYTVQLIYFMPIRWIRYHKIGYHYFLADLCYFVNFLLVLTIWIFPRSKRLFISTYCLAFGNNAIAIAMWRNSLVFHSLDKVTSLFIHIMPCATLHVMTHLLSETQQRKMFPALHTIKYSLPGAPEHYTLWDMILWATLPYAVWQLSYHFLITVRKRSKIAAGRPTSFTWLRRSYKGNFLGKFVLGFPESLQETVFMCIQYTYALLTMLPCPLWFWYSWASAAFMLIMFTWASWNGATYYIDAYGKRMEKELEQLRKEVQRMSKSPDITGMDGTSPINSPGGPQGLDGVLDGASKSTALDLGPAAVPADGDGPIHRRTRSEESVPTTIGTDDLATPGLEMGGIRDMANPADIGSTNDTPDVGGPSLTDEEIKKME
ncbi:putative membrane protein [Acrodontium crateriforme]|uniref:Glycerophosphocholine acyltransferase 1 n=1 Tax=Acrodontium crateriforme TaxID=150365 RepID=A0AAQ3LY21_9PEZI|nr:putative membrane protein [Acrodontium crateriforme]